jgi:opacity protein-like surface antigen
MPTYHSHLSISQQLVYLHRIINIRRLIRDTRSRTFLWQTKDDYPMRCSCRGAVIAALSTCLLFNITASHANGPDRSYPSPWAGVYFGIHGGIASSQIDYTIAATIGAPETMHHAFNGTLWGAHFGALYSFGPIIIGPEIAYTHADLNETIPSIVFPERSRVVRITDMLTVSARAGIPIGNALIYGKAGFALVDLSIRGINPGVFDYTTRDHETAFVYGVGAEWQLTPALSLALEWSTFELDKPADRNLPSLPIPRIFHTIGADGDLFMARLNMRLPGR